MAYTAISAFVLDQIFGYQTANKLRLNIEAALAVRFHKHLGGSRTIALARTAAAQDAIDYLDVEIDGTNLTGLTKQARVEVRTLGATTVTPKVRNVTDSTDAGTGVACAGTAADYSGTNQKQTIALTIASGVKKYRLMATPSATTDDTFAIGGIEIYI